jgi:hypothetical protein
MYTAEMLQVTPTAIRVLQGYELCRDVAGGTNCGCLGCCRGTSFGEDVAQGKPTCARSVANEKALVPEVLQKSAGNTFARDVVKRAFFLLFSL